MAKSATGGGGFGAPYSLWYNIADVRIPVQANGGLRVGSALAQQGAL